MEINKDLHQLLYAPDVEAYSRLSYEISEIDRMKADFALNKKKYFDKKNKEDLIKYDNNQQVNDLVENVPSETYKKIAELPAYKAGIELGMNLKKKHENKENGKDQATAATYFIKNVGLRAAKKKNDPVLNKAEELNDYQDENNENEFYISTSQIIDEEGSDDYDEESEVDQNIVNGSYGEEDVELSANRDSKEYEMKIGNEMSRSFGQNGDSD